tara:strand:+ start:349 stop:504 length:156 start_codon:yes stop_codon:yes gene_type:complete
MGLMAKIGEINLLQANLDWERIESQHHREFAQVYRATKAYLRTSGAQFQSD